MFQNALDLFWGIFAIYIGYNGLVLAFDMYRDRRMRLRRRMREQQEYLGNFTKDDKFRFINKKKLEEDLDDLNNL